MGLGETYKKHLDIWHSCIYLLSYYWWKKSFTTWDINEPKKNNGMICLSSGAGFLPSTVSLAFPYHLFLNLPTGNMCTKFLAPIEEACPNVQLSAENQRGGWLFWSSNIAGRKISLPIYIDLSYNIISYILIKHLPEDFGGKWPISDFKWKNHTW